MLSPMPLYLVPIVLVYSFCLLKVVRAAMDAPIGYEDPRGFHYGLRSVSVDADSLR